MNPNEPRPDWLKTPSPDGDITNTLTSADWRKQLNELMTNIPDWLKDAMQESESSSLLAEVASVSVDKPTVIIEPAVEPDPPQITLPPTPAKPSFAEPPLLVPVEYPSFLGMSEADNPLAHLSLFDLDSKMDSLHEKLDAQKPKSDKFSVSEPKIDVAKPKAEMAKIAEPKVEIAKVVAPKMEPTPTPVPKSLPATELPKLEPSSSEPFELTAPQTISMRSLRQPILRLHMPERITFLSDQTIELVIDVHNEGNASAQHVKLELTLASELELVSISPGQYDAYTHHVQWTIDELAKEARQTLILRLTSPVPSTSALRGRLFDLTGRETRSQTEIVCEFDASRSDVVLEKACQEDLAAEPDHFEETLAESYLWDAAPTPREEVGSQHLIFTLAQTDYAIPLANVVEVDRPLAVTAVPSVPDWLLGVCNVRGDIVSMVHLRSFLGLVSDHSQPANRMLIVRSSQDADFRTALLVDHVQGIRSIARHRITQPTSPITGKVASWMRGVAEQDHRLVVLLDSDRLLASEEMRQFESQ